jgi:hypothetical protein
VGPEGISGVAGMGGSGGRVIVTVPSVVGGVDGLGGGVDSGELGGATSLLATLQPIPLPENLLQLPPVDMQSL